MNFARIMFALGLLTLINHTVYGQGIVTPGTTEIGEYGTDTNPIYWTLNGNYTAQSDFTIGHSNQNNSGNYNILTVDNGQTFNAEQNLILGPIGSDYNRINVQAGATVDVDGNMYIGTGSSSYYCTGNNVNVTGDLSVNGDLIVGSKVARSSILNLLDGGLVQVFGDFNLYSHWYYTNSWLILNGGILALSGDRTDDFTQGSRILASIKVWDDISGDFQAIADYTGSITSSTVNNEYSHLLNVEYVTNPNDDLFGYTLINATHAVPEPTAMALFVFGAFVVLRRKKD